MTSSRYNCKVLSLVAMLLVLCERSVVTLAGRRPGGSDDVAGTMRYDRSSSVSSDYSVCPAAARNLQYLDSVYRCRPNEFSALTACEGERIDLRCQKSQFIVIRSAVFGSSISLRQDAVCHSQNAPNDRGCPLSCVLQSVVNQCNGRRRCPVDVTRETFSSSRCSPTATVYLSILHTCVSKNMLRALDSNGDDNSDLLSNPCGNTDYDLDADYHQFTTTSPSPSTISTTTTTPSTTSTTTPSTTTSTTTMQTQYFWDDRNFGPAPDERMRYIPGGTRTSTHNYQIPYQPVTSSRAPPYSIPVDENRVRKANTPRRSQVLDSSAGRGRKDSDICLFSLADWIWTWQFANDNKEKFVLYMVIGLCIGTIAILVAILFHFALRQQPSRPVTRRFKHREIDATVGLQSTNIGSSCGSPTWRDGAGAAESESSTGDDRTLHDVEDVEMNNFNQHIDSLPRRAGVASTAPKCHHHQHQLQYQQQQQQLQQQYQQQAGGGNVSTGATAVTRPGSALGAPTTTATINRSYATITATGRCHNPATTQHPGNGGLTMGHTPNGYGGSSAGYGGGGTNYGSGVASYTLGGPRYSALQSGGGVSYNATGVGTTGAGATTGSGATGGGATGGGATNSGSASINRGPMIGSLGRSFASVANQYGQNHDLGYQFDAQDNGSRTLQPMQHYYG